MLNYFLQQVYLEKQNLLTSKTGIAAKLAPEDRISSSTCRKRIGNGREGAIISSPQALAQVALDKDPKATAESLCLGFGIGHFTGLEENFLEAL